MNIPKVMGLATGAIPIVGILIGGITFGINFKTDVDTLKEDITHQESVNAEVAEWFDSLPGKYDDTQLRVELNKIGVEVDNLLVSQPDSGEQALEISEMLVRSSTLDVCIVDSVAALVPKAELEGEMGDSHMGLQARLMSQALRKLTGIVSKSKTCLIFINQIREKIGVMFGNPETTTGGRALKFYSSVRVDVRRIAAIKDGDEITGNRTKVKIVKNKVAPPFRQAEFDILYGLGISKEGDLLDLGVEKGIIEKRGAWYSINGERMGQGRENARQFLIDNEVVRVQIEDELCQVLNIPSRKKLSKE